MGSLPPIIKCPRSPKRKTKTERRKNQENSFVLRKKKLLFYRCRPCLLGKGMRSPRSIDPARRATADRWAHRAGPLHADGKCELTQALVSRRTSADAGKGKQRRLRKSGATGRGAFQRGTRSDARGAAVALWLEPDGIRDWPNQSPSATSSSQVRLDTGNSGGWGEIPSDPTAVSWPGAQP